MESIDWEKLARQIGAIQENTSLGAYSERGGDLIACQALVLILGDNFWRDAVDYYVDGGRGSAVISSITAMLHPKPVMERCYEIYQSDADIDTRRYALTLFADAADYSALPWISALLDDLDEEINGWGAVTLDHLLQTMWLRPPPEFAEVLEKAEKHLSQRVREQVKDSLIRERYEDKSEPGPSWLTDTPRGDDQPESP
jgi:hypothetical protein